MKEKNNIQRSLSYDEIQQKNCREEKIEEDFKKQQKFQREEESNVQLLEKQQQRVRFFLFLFFHISL